MKDVIVYVLSCKKEKENASPTKETVAVKTGRRSRQLQEHGLIHLKTSSAQQYQRAHKKCQGRTVEFADVKLGLLLKVVGSF